MNWIRKGKGWHSMNVVEQYPEAVKDRCKSLEIEYYFHNASVNIDKSRDSVLFTPMPIQLSLDKVIKERYNKTPYEVIHRPLSDRMYQEFVLCLR